MEVSNKEVVDTLIHFSTPMKSKKPRIIVRPPSSPPKPIKRVKSRSQAQASNAAITYALEVFWISLEPQEEVRTDPQDMELLESTPLDPSPPMLTPSLEKESKKFPQDPQLQIMK